MLPHQHFLSIMEWFLQTKGIMSKKTLVIGASEDPSRYSYLAINKLVSNGHEVVAIGKKEGEVSGVHFGKELLPFEDVDTVTLYINPVIQKKYYDYIVSLKPTRVIFNPGTENEEFYFILQQNGIYPQESCTLVMLSTNQY
jgi:predicted CoA-binding protein